MKKSQEIIGLPVFAIINGRKIGQVKDMVINPEEGKVDFILVSNGSWYVGARVLPYKDVMGIGEHAVTTESENLLTTLNETVNANNLLERNIEIKGNRVLTNKGNLIGVISEYEIDETTGKLSRLEYKTAEDESKIEIIAAEDVLTYGTDVLVVKEKDKSTSTDGWNQQANEIQEQAGDADTEQGTEGAAFFKQKQRQFLLGKKLIRDIKNADGNILITEGTVITEEILDLADKNNRFIELSQSAK